MRCGLFKSRRGGSFKYLEPDQGEPLFSQPVGERKGSKRQRAGRMEMEMGSFSVEWLAQSSHEKGQTVSGVSSTPYPPRGASRQTLPKSAARAGGDQEKGNQAVSGSSSRSRERSPECARRRPGEKAAPSPKEAEAGGEGRGSEGCTQPGRPRTKFSASQLQELERSFREQRYIGASEKRRLSKVLKLSQTQIKTWFQNRRMKFKRQTQDARVEALFSGLLLPYHRYPEIQAPSYPHGMEFSVSSSPAAAVTCSLHPAMPSPALLLPPAPAQSLQPVVPTPALLLPAAPGFSYHSTIPKVSLTQEHNRLRFQPYLPPS
ncbi:homeobox protein vex1-like [Emydura macquarii macquarii]|uniref:homeobox protein vex1-like n=1 Tax=Emydura macquarii macquarii TaxID=1129001 RepID=UPI00352B0F56